MYMKKIWTLLLILLCFVNTAFAKDDNIVKFEGNKYRLLYSVKSEENNGYLNEYYKFGEGVNTWTEMIAVHHFPNMYSPISQAESFREYLDVINCPSAIYVNEEENTGMLDFILINSQNLPVILEFNVFKYEKSPECGTIAIQYVKRYSVTSSLDIETVKEEFAKLRKRVIKDIEKAEIPKIINKSVNPDLKPSLEK